MRPYEFTSKTHSLSTEDLGKFFIHSLIDSFIDLPFNTAGIFYLTQNSSSKIRRNSEKIRKKNWMKVKNITQSCHEVEEAVFSVQG